jgi:hypothetical protein
VTSFFSQAAKVNANTMVNKRTGMMDSVSEAAGVGELAAPFSVDDVAPPIMKRRMEIASLLPEPKQLARNDFWIVARGEPFARERRLIVQAPFYSGGGNSLPIASMTRASIGSMSVAKTAAMWPSRPTRYL